MMTMVFEIYRAALTDGELASVSKTSSPFLNSTVTRLGPRKMKEPMGRFGSLSPERARMTASATACTAWCWPMTRWWRIWSRRRSPYFPYSQAPEAGFIPSLLRPAAEEDRWRDPFLVATSFDWRRQER